MRPMLLRFPVGRMHTGSRIRLVVSNEGVVEPVSAPGVIKMRKFPGVDIVLLLIIGMCLVSGTVTNGHAALFGYTDEGDVLHITNRPLSDLQENEIVPVTAANQPSGVWIAVDHAYAGRLYDGFIKQAGEYYSIPMALVKAVIAAESAFEPSAVSSAGAVGLMQLRPRTAAAMAVSNSLDPKENIFGGVRYLRIMLNRFEGDVALAVAAYNAGPSAVEKYGGIPPYQETRAYVGRVLKLYQFYLMN